MNESRRNFLKLIPAAAAAPIAAKAAEPFVSRTKIIRAEPIYYLPTYDTGGQLEIIISEPTEQAMWEKLQKHWEAHPEQGIYGDNKPFWIRVHYEDGDSHIFSPGTVPNPDLFYDPYDYGGCREVCAKIVERGMDGNVSYRGEDGRTYYRTPLS